MATDADKDETIRKLREALRGARTYFLIAQEYSAHAKSFNWNAPLDEIRIALAATTQPVKDGKP